MGVDTWSIKAPTLEKAGISTLLEAGFNPIVRGQVITLTGVGHHTGDQSVNMGIDLLEVDGFRILRFSSVLTTPPANFDDASLACVRGNGASTIPKYEVLEVIPDETNIHRFGLRASFHLYADHLSREESRVMLILFLKEIDEIDNELAEMMARKNGSGTR